MEIYANFIDCPARTPLEQRVCSQRQIAWIKALETSSFRTLNDSMDQDLNPFPDDFYFLKKKLRPTMITGEKRDKFSEKLFQKKGPPHVFP